MIIIYLKLAVPGLQYAIQASLPLHSLTHIGTPSVHFSSPLCLPTPTEAFSHSFDLSLSLLLQPSTFWPSAVTPEPPHCDAEFCC